MYKNFTYKLLLLLSALAICSSLNAASVRVDVDNLRYTVDTDTQTAELYGPVSSSTVFNNLVIPDNIEYSGSLIPVTSIRNSAFSSNKNLKGSLTIGNHVLTIGEDAFYKCSGFAGILTLGDKVEIIGEEAFRNCSGFTGSLSIPNKVQIIGNRAFESCSGFTGSLNIGANVQTIGNYAFESCSGFTGSLTIGNNVQIIGNSAFYNCSGFTGTLTIPNKVQTIGNSAFRNCSGFTGSLFIGDKVQTIGNYAFGNCSGFTGSLNIGNDVEVIGELAFVDCYGFTGSLTIGYKVQTIGKYAFSSCSGFTGTLTIPDKVQTIGEYAFASCSGFTGTLILGGNVQTIGDYAFNVCSGFTGSLTIGDNVQTIGKYAFFSCKGFTGSLTIGDNVQTIGDYAFDNCEGFTGSLTIGDSVEIIGNSAFSSCSGFTGPLIIPDKVQTIGGRAFNDCKNFTGELTIPVSVKEIGSGCFSGCDNLTSLVITSSNTVINYQAFQCYGLESITCLGSIPPKCVYGSSGSYNYDYVFYSSSYDKPLYVPDESVNLYKNATEWKKFKYINPIPVEATGISLNKTELSLLVGQEETLIATLTPEDATTEIVWSIAGDDNIISVDQNGKVKALSVGTTNVVATAGEVYASCKVTVNPVLASNVIINVPDKEIFVGDVITLSATVLPENTTNPAVTWRSDKPEIATINSETGELAAIAPGQVTITATCGDVSSTAIITVLPVMASSVQLSAQDLTLLVGQTDKLTATVIPENTTDKTITWKSDNEAVATVSTDGTVTAVSVGVANITATCGEVSASCKVTVNPVMASGVTLSAQDLSLLVGQTDKLTATVTPQNTTDKTIAWKSDNEAVATVGADGTVTAVSVGVANITATCGEVSATCKVTVNPVVATGVTLNVQDMTLLVGQTDKLTATVTPENTTDKTIAWKSDNEAVATVSADGTVTAVSVGVANITATCGEATATCKVMVNPVVASGVTLSAQDMMLLVGQTDKLIATVTPENTTDKTITWKSDNEAVATVSADGTVTAVSVGVANITATCGEASAICRVTVNPILATSISIDGSDIHTLKQTETLQLTVTVVPDNTTYQEIVWKSSDDNKATVSNSGLVTAIEEGDVEIIATLSYQPQITTSYNISIQKRLLGDANDNGVVNVADVGTISDYIVEKQVYQFCFVNADVITDGKITTADVTATVDIIFNDTPSMAKFAKARKIFATGGNELIVDNFNSSASSMVDVNLKNPSEFTGLQGSIIIPEGVTIRNVTKGAGASHHILNYNVTDRGTVEFILYSLQNNSFDETGSLIELEILADGNSGDLAIENILASDSEANEYSLSFSGGKNNDLITSLDGVENELVQIYSVSDGIVILNAHGEIANIFTIAGERIVSEVVGSNKEFYSLTPDIYIVTVKSETAKLIVK